MLKRWSTGALQNASDNDARSICRHFLECGGARAHVIVRGRCSYASKRPKQRERRWRGFCYGKLSIVW